MQFCTRRWPGGIVGAYSRTVHYLSNLGQPGLDPILFTLKNTTKACKHKPGANPGSFTHACAARLTPQSLMGVCKSAHVQNHNPGSIQLCVYTTTSPGSTRVEPTPIEVG